MIPTAYLETQRWRMSQAREPAELRAYLRSEWGIDDALLPGFLARPQHRPGVRRPGWFLRWRVARRSARLASAADGGAVPDPTVRPTEAAECAHPAMEPLGLDATAAFLRCALCGSVLVLDCGRRYAVGAACEACP